MHGSENKLFLQCSQARVFIKIQLLLAQFQKYLPESLLPPPWTDPEEYQTTEGWTLLPG